ncbi:MAG: primosomal protein N' [Gemmatimonadetes bacterium]|nr:primosomal protein N' [Gemmatimonadota bacterium]
MSSIFVVVALPVPPRREFTYRLPDAWRAPDLVGRRAVVPFGPRQLTGVIVEVTPDPPPVEAKDVLDLLDEAPLVSSEMLALTRWVAEYYVASWGETLRSALPVGWNKRSRRYAVLARDPGADTSDPVLNELRGEERLPVSTLVSRLGSGAGVENSLRKLARAGAVTIESVLEETSGAARTETWAEILPAGALDGSENELRSNAVRQRECLLYLRQKRKALRAELTGRFGKAVFGLEKRGLLQFVEEDRMRIADGSLQKYAPEGRVLTREQKEALAPILAAVNEKRYETFLLHGITGSGKTEVYLQAATKVREGGRSVLVLVPEIALTPQTVGRFRARFGADTAVIHSALTPAERHDTWRGIARGAFPVVVGVRSAIFAPLPNLGLIIVDEEHDTSYKQSESPRYHARDVAVVRGRQNGIPVVLGSATPSLESYGNAVSGKYRKMRLDSRIGNRPLPVVEVVDIRDVPYPARKSVLAPLLLERIAQALSTRNQVMIFLNRRGFSPFLTCGDCGWAPRCPHCDVTYTFHKRENVLRCHYCGTEQRPPAKCPECESEKLDFRGIGTQRVEEDLLAAFPSVRIARMDLDTTRRKDSARLILELFSNREIEILVGTQMIAKGHHFPGISLVGVINADTALHLPDFRAGERTFQLITQVSGRAGRGDEPGEVVLQSFHPEHYCIHAASSHDYDTFVAHEMKDREELKYPPFSRVVSFTFRGKRENVTREAAHAFLAYLRADEHTTSRVWELLGPTPAPIAKIRDRWRWRVLLKGKLETWGALRKRLGQMLDHWDGTPLGRRVQTAVDVDAFDLL